MKKIFTLLTIVAVALSMNAQEMQTKDLTLMGMVKTQFSRMGRGYTALEDKAGNTFQIYNESAKWAYGEYTVTAYLAADDITVSGTGVWDLVDDAETLIATLTDEDQTFTYNVTAIVSALKTFNLTCSDAQYFTRNIGVETTTFVGMVDSVLLKITIDNMAKGSNKEVYGVYGETDILAESVTVMGTVQKYTLSGTFEDAIGNTYKVSMRATPMTPTLIEVTNVTYTEADSTIVVSGIWNDSTLTITLNGASASDSLVCEDATMEVGDILATSTAVTFTQVADSFTLTGEFTHADETAIYTLSISGSNTIVEEIPTKDLTLIGMVKTQISRIGRGYTSLEDKAGNTFQIYNESAKWAYGEYTVTAYLAADDITVSGTGVWDLVDDAETLIATLTDEEQTVTYNVTAIVSALKTFNLTCSDAQYFTRNIGVETTTFVGMVDSVLLKITIDNMAKGSNKEVYGVYGETDILAESVTVMGTVQKYTLSGTFEDAIGNTYKVSMKATPMTPTLIEVTNATYTEADSTIVVTGIWNDSALTITLNNFSASDSLVCEDATMEVGDVLATSTAVTFTQTADSFTLTGEFTHENETAIYTLSISGSNTPTALDYIGNSHKNIKAIKNGQLIIIRDNEIYNAQGMRL